MKRIGQILLFSLILKLILAAFLPLSTDESYYWVWSHFPALSYYDHPPFVAWLYWIAQPLENWGTLVRWPGVFLGQLTLLVWVQILRDRVSEKALFWFVLLALLSPLTGPGSLIVTPDTPLLFFWSLLVWGMVQGLDTGKKSWDFFLGVVFGLCFLSKYTCVLFFPIYLLVLLLRRTPPSRILQGFLLGVAGFALTSWPVWLWNHQNEWISFGFQLDHGLGAKTWKPSWTVEYFLGQLVLISPFVLFAAWKAKSAPTWLKLCAWFPPFFFLFTTSGGYAEANWPIMAYLPMMALAVWQCSSFKWAKWTAAVWGIAFLILLAFMALADFSFMQPLYRQTKLKELYKFKEVEPFVRKHTNVYARTYQMAAKLSFEMKRPIFKLRGINRFDFFDMRPESIPHGDFWLLAKPTDELPEIFQDQFFLESTVPLTPETIAQKWVKK